MADEKNLDVLPEYGGAGGSEQAARYYAGQEFYKLFGRNPSELELTQLAPAYMTGDPNKAGVAQGNAAVAQFYSNKTNTPQQQLSDQNAQLQKDAPKYYDQINQQFQSTLGRDATQQEKDHFGSLMASGTTDAYTVGTFLQQLPEAVTKQDAAFRTSLQGDITKADSQYFNEQVLPGIQQNFAKSGRDFNSSGFANAAAQAGQQQNVNRQGFLANLSANQYAGNKTNAYNDYLNSVGRQQGMADYSQQRSDSQNDALLNSISGISNYNTQKSAYDQYLQRYGKRTGGAQGAVGGAAAGATAGAAFGPYGAAIGGVAGGIAGYFA